MRKFLNLSERDVEELQVKIDVSPGRTVITGSEGLIFEIAHKIVPDEFRDASRYTACLCRASLNAANDTRVVSLGEAGGRLGYLFPLAAYGEEDILEDNWQRRFAEVGMRKLSTFSELDKYSRVREIDALRARQSLEAYDFFPADSSMLVLSNDAVKKTRLSVSALSLMLKSVGVVVLDSHNDRSRAPYTLAGSSNINLKRISSYFTRDAELFLSLSRTADSDMSGVGAFIINYQVIEYCIDKIFSWKIEEVSRMASDTWKLREQLGSAASEKGRLAALSDKCLSSQFDRSCARELKDRCIEFLDGVLEDDLKDAQWYDVMYKMRNFVVHNQVMMLRQKQDILLEEINTNLRKVCFEIMAGFVKPQSFY